MANHPTPADFTKLLKKVFYSQGLYRTFSDFLTLASACIAKPVNPHGAEAIEASCMAVAGKYKAEQLKVFTELLGMVMQAFYGDEPYIDFLGLVLMNEELHNKRAGQFFTPIHLCQLMAEMSLAEVDPEPDKILTIDEPAVGAGVCVLAAANVLKKKGYPYHSHLFVRATDLDRKCFQMAYIQLSLAGVPAVIRHGNTLSQEMFEAWATPLYVFNKIGPRLELQRFLHTDKGLEEEEQKTSEV